ncbi:protein yellow-like [Cloeon dipterum]|uniref:protein yellow-like n=1 Tax=Cloeon dipterum TaxID=197152 RepID=UPI00322048E0
MWLPTSGTSTAPPKLALFPSLDLHKEDNCDTIQWAKGMETDTDGRLWALDLGSSNCPSKLWIFDLLNNDRTERVHQFPDTVVSHSYNKRKLHDLVLDKTPDDYLAYIADLFSERIVVYSRKTDKSWSVKTTGDRWLSLAISPNREARQSLYLIGILGSKVLNSVSVSELKNEGGSAAVKFIGNFTEKPYRMLIDSANVLYAAFYFQNYFSKWNTSEPFREQRLHEVGSLDGSLPFTFALDENDTLWVMERNVIGGEARHKLLKAAVGARS